MNQPCSAHPPPRVAAFLRQSQPTPGTHSRIAEGPGIRICRLDCFLADQEAHSRRVSTNSPKDETIWVPDSRSETGCRVWGMTGRLNRYPQRPLFGSKANSRNAASLMKSAARWVVRSNLAPLLSRLLLHCFLLIESRGCMCRMGVQYPPARGRETRRNAQSGLPNGRDKPGHDEL